MPALPMAKLPPVKDPQIAQLDVNVTGERGTVVGRARVPIELLDQFEASWIVFREAYPYYTLEQFIRYVIRKGTIAASRAAFYNVVPRPRSPDGV